MKDANGLDAAPRCRQLADTEQEVGDTVNPHEAAGPRSRWNHACGLTADERRGAALVEPDGRPSGQSGLGRLYPRPEVRSTGGQLAPRHGVLEAKGADTAAHEILDRAAAAERRTDVGREHPYVCSLATDDADGGPRAGDFLDGDRPDSHLARRALDLDALAGQLVQATPVVVNRRIHRWHLLDAADEGTAHRFEARHRDLEARSLRHDPTAHLVRIRRQAEPDRREIFLVLIDQVRRELCRFADEDRQHAGRVGIECAGVADAANAQTTARERDDVERGRAGPLVDDQDPGPDGAVFHDAGLPPTARRAAARTRRAASAKGPGTVQPAALTWPPPPNCAAIFWTSTSPLPRRLTFTCPSRSRRRHATRTEATERG